MRHHRKRRLRKKFHMGEFTEYGFDVNAELHPAAMASVVLSNWPPKRTDVLDVIAVQDDKPVNKLLDDFISTIEARGLCCGGGAGYDHGSAHATMNLFVTRPHMRGKKPAPVTEDDRAALKAFLESWKLDGFTLKKTGVGPLVDAWA